MEPEALRQRSGGWSTDRTRTDFAVRRLQKTGGFPEAQLIEAGVGS